MTDAVAAVDHVAVAAIYGFLLVLLQQQKGVSSWHSNCWSCFPMIMPPGGSTVNRNFFCFFPDCLQATHPGCLILPLRRTHAHPD